MRLILIITVLFFKLMPLKAQVYEGKITDVDGQPIVRASVIVSDSLHNPLSFTRSDVKGEYKLKVPVGKSVSYIVFTAVGYAKQELNILNYKNHSIIKMEAKAIELKEVVVKDEPVKRSGDTLTYRVSAFKQAYDRSIEDVIAKMPGLKVDDIGIIYYNNKAIRNFYIEDMNMMGNQYVQASRNLSADRVESVQVYERHEEVKALQGISKNNEVALNIKLKKSAKNIKICGRMLSESLLKLSKNIEGISENNMVIPPVNRNEMPTYFILGFICSGSSNNFFSASIANKGMVNSAITRIEATVRNFAYIGI